MTTLQIMQEMHAAHGGFMRDARKSYHATNVGKQIQVHHPTVDPNYREKRKPRETNAKADLDSDDEEYCNTPTIPWSGMLPLVAL
jgi:hypothetical protein